MTHTPPATMRALQLSAYDSDIQAALQNLRVVTIDTPRTGPGEVLVKMEATPCNPSDLLFLQGMYGVTKHLPCIPGWEGCGTVVASGPGVIGRFLVGKRVSCGGQDQSDGTWAEYYIAKASSCIPLPKSIGTEQGASLIVNPLTALGLFESAVAAGHNAAVQTAGASQVGRMLVSLALNYKFPLISIVRKNEHVELLRSLGAHLVFNSEAENFDEALREACASVQATVAFDAVSGPMTGTLLTALPNNGEVVVYGGLSYEPCNDIDPLALLFENKRIRGFYLGTYLGSKSLLSRLRFISRAKHLVANEVFETNISHRVSLADAVEGLERYISNMSAGKVLICPHHNDAS